MKKILLFTLLLFSITQSPAQIKFVTGASVTSAANLDFYADDGSGNIYSCSNGGSALSLLLYPKYNFRELGPFSLGVGMPISIGGGAESSSSSQGGSSSSSLWVYSLPVTIDINGGKYSSQGGGRFGYYGGMGLVYNGISGSESNVFSYNPIPTTAPSGEKIYSFYDPPSYSSFGIFMHAGASYRIPSLFSSERPGFNLGIHVSQSIGITGRNYTHVGLLFYERVGSKGGNSGRATKKRKSSSSKKRSTSKKRKKRKKKRKPQKRKKPKKRKKRSR